MTCTRGRTGSFRFQFTPLREGRQHLANSRCGLIKFQFTPLREGRLLLQTVRFRHNRISIHAPPRGATESKEANALLGKDFNSRPSARGDDGFDTNIQRVGEFQFTPLREGRQLRTERGNVWTNFNSRPSARGDGNWVRKIKTIDISIHAPPRGATRTTTF